MIETKIAGIPCLIEPGHVCVVKGSFRYDAPSDMDYLGYSEVEFTVCDRRGRPAPWLERKMTDDDVREIEYLILKENDPY